MPAISTSSRYIDIDLGAPIQNEKRFEVYDWETPRTTQFRTKEEREKLCEENKGIIESRATAFASANTKYDFDDLLSQAYLGFTEALNGYDPRKGELSGAAFSTYAFKCITTALTRHCQKIEYRSQREVSMEDHIAEDSNGHVESWEDTIADDTPNIQDDIQKAEAIALMLEIMKSQLDPTDYYILMHMYGANGFPQLNQSQIAAHLGMSQANVSKRAKHAQTAMRIILQGKYGSEAKTLFCQHENL